MAYTSKQELKGEAIFWLANRLPTVLGPQIAINYEDNPPPDMPTGQSDLDNPSVETPISDDSGLCHVDD